MSRERCGPVEPVAAEPVDACCGSPEYAAPGALEKLPPWWRDRALALPVASGVLWVSGLIVEWTGQEIAGIVVFALGLAAGAWTFVPSAIRRLATGRDGGDWAWDC